MRRAPLVVMVSLLAPLGCTVRPPPIKSPPALSDPPGQAECTMSDGIDPNGHPACSDGCTWSVPLKRCAPEEVRSPTPQIPPNGV